MIDQKNYGIPQLETFSPLLKFKLAISVIYDVIGLIFHIAFIVGTVAIAYWAYTEKVWEPEPQKKAQISKQQRQ
jgi:hypothetical protein